MNDYNIIKKMLNLHHGSKNTNTKKRGNQT